MVSGAGVPTGRRLLLLRHSPQCGNLASISSSVHCSTQPHVCWCASLAGNLAGVRCRSQQRLRRLVNGCCRAACWAPAVRASTPAKGPCSGDCSWDGSRADNLMAAAGRGELFWMCKEGGSWMCMEGDMADGFVGTTGVVSGHVASAVALLRAYVGGYF